MLTHGAMQGCGLTYLVVCINDKFCDIRERNVTIRSEFSTMNIHSLGFWDIRECCDIMGVDIMEFRVYYTYVKLLKLSEMGLFTLKVSFLSKGAYIFLLYCYER